MEGVDGGESDSVAAFATLAVADEAASVFSLFTSADGIVTVVLAVDNLKTGVVVELDDDADDEWREEVSVFTDACFRFRASL